MKAFLHASCPIAVWIITALEALFVILALRGWKRKKRISTGTASNRWRC